MEEKTNRTRTSKRILVLASLAAGVLLAGLLLLISPWGNREAAGAPVLDLTEQPAIPPIDAAAPEDVQTATFALG
jgi:hypothetical protein